MTPLDELAAFLRPRGAGITVFSTGRRELLRAQDRLAGVAGEAAIARDFHDRLARIERAAGVILGIPSDIGGGFRRGSAFGPMALRLQLLDDGVDLDALNVVDIGDVWCVPQLNHDEMLTAEQLAATQDALFASVPLEARRALPVSPLSIAERAFELVLALNPKAKLFTLGGDHSTALPAVSALAKAKSPPANYGLVQFDAHTDLLQTRLGVKHCFATWSWYANELLGRNGRLVQAGVRASGHPRQHWESTLGVRQFWAADVLANPAQALDDLIAHLDGAGVKTLSISDDIDGTDSAWADATGTPEPNGLEPDWVIELIRRVGARYTIASGDIMEVAPPLGASPLGSARTVALGARYFTETLHAALRRA